MKKTGGNNRKLTYVIYPNLAALSKNVKTHADFVKLLGEKNANFKSNNFKTSDMDWERVIGLDLLKLHSIFEPLPYFQNTADCVNKVDFCYGYYVKFDDNGKIKYDQDINYFNCAAKVKFAMETNTNRYINSRTTYANLYNVESFRKFMPATYDLAALDKLPDKSPYIVKVEGSFMQSGVHITQGDDYATLRKQLLDAKSSGIVSKYITNPSLIEGKKFNLRVYFLVRKTDHDTSYYVHDEFRIFTAAEPYTTNNDKFDPKSHITGRPMTAKRYEFDDLGAHGYDETKRNIITSRIREMLAEYAAIINPHVKKYNSDDSNCMVYGADVIVDTNLQPQLLEVNYRVGFSEFGDPATWPEYNARFSERYFKWIYDCAVAPFFGLPLLRPGLHTMPICRIVDGANKFDRPEINLIPIESATLEQLEQLAKIGELPEVYEKLGQGVKYDMARLRELIDYKSASDIDGLYLNYIICINLSDKNTAIGFISAHPAKFIGQPDDIQLRYFIDPQRGGKGFATAAVMQLERIILARFNDERPKIFIVAETDNLPSLAIAKKLNYKQFLLKNKESHSAYYK